MATYVHRTPTNIAITMQRLKIFVSAYACEPDLGSEIGVGWHWVLEMSKYFDLYVLTRASNKHTIEPWVAVHPEYSHIHFYYYDLPQWARFWKRGMKGVRIYYNLWQYFSDRIVKRVMQKHAIKIFHHVTYGNVMWKVSSYGQRQFFIWGPVGGLETIPSEYSQHYDKSSRRLEFIRRVIVRLMRLSPSFRLRCSQANLILCKTEITRSLVPSKYRHKAILFTDVAVDATKQIQQLTGEKVNHQHTTFVTIGRLDAWRGFDLIIEAMAEAVKHNANIHLTIVGDGIDCHRLQALVDTHELRAHITFAGYVPMTAYYLYMYQSDAVINASLKEGAVTVSFDSMAMGKPLLCIDTTGYTRYFSNDYAIVVPRSDRATTISQLAQGILALTDTTIRQQLGDRARAAGIKFTWEARGREIRDAILTAWHNHLKH